MSAPLNIDFALWKLFGSGDQDVFDAIMAWLDEGNTLLTLIQALS